ncbi:MAG: S41 family peptidase, partial [Bacteroidetes bacterium QS_1_65_9]
TVRITVERQGTSDPLTFTLTREQVDPPDVTYRGRIGDEEQFGYVKLDRFTRDAPTEVETALEELQAAEALRGVILDLRDNPGGLLRAAVRITELFVPKGSVIVSTKGRGGENENAYASDRVPLLPDVPVVVLVNDQSASASEIVAGALQDYDRGVVMGTTTYGKGLVQNVRSLPHNTALKLTTAQYYTPSGRTIQALTVGRDSAASAQLGQTHQTAGGRTVRDGDGIRPDVRVSGTRPSALEQALTRRAAFFRYANHYAATHDTLDPGFAVTDADLEAFQTWLDAEEIAYSTRAERALDSIRAQVEAQGYEAAADETAALADALQSAKKNAFDRHGSALQQHLKREILSRCVSAGRRTEALLPADEQVSAATDLLRDSNRYEQILTADE